MSPTFRLNMNNSVPLIWIFFPDHVLPYSVSDNIQVPDLISFDISLNESPLILHTKSGHSTHARKPPSYSRDYHCNSILSSHSPTHHPLSQVLYYDRLSCKT